MKIKNTNDFMKHISSKRFYIHIPKLMCGSHLQDLKESAIEEGDVLLQEYLFGVIKKEVHEGSKRN